MNVLCKNVKYCVNLDWLQYSVVLKNREPELYCPDGYRLEILTGNNIYKHRWVLYNAGGTKLATALWHPYSSVLDSFVATVQIANIWLYDPYGVEYVHSLVQDVWDCTFNSVGRMDVCLDFCANDRQMSIVRKLSSNAMYMSGRGEGSIFWHNRCIADGNKIVREPHCFSWGSKNSDIKIKMYWKSREVGLIGEKDEAGKDILPDVEKEYIVDEWRKNGFDIKRVWRIEFSMCSTGQMMFDGRLVTFKNLCSGEWHVKVFSSLFNSRWKIRKNTGKRTKKHNYDPIVYLLDFQYDNIVMRYREHSKDRLPDGEVITTLRRMLRDLESPAVIGNEYVFGAMCEAIRGIVVNNGMGSWCEKKLPRGLDGYFEDVWNHGGFGIHECDENHARFIQ